MEVIKTINLIQLFRDSVQKYSDRISFVSERQYITYSQLNRAVNSVAGIVKQSGIEKGDNVAVMLSNIPEFVYSYFGVLKTGAAVVPINTSSTSFELTYLLNNSDSRILITQTSQIKKYQEAKDKLLSCHQVIAVDSLNQNGELIAGADSNDSSFCSTEINPEDPAVIVYTAGLTGKPLGAVLTHRNLCEQLNMIHPLFHRSPDDVGLCLIPLFHTFGATLNMLNVIQAGCSTVMMDRLTMESLFSKIEKEKITYICAVPRLYMGMAYYEKAAKYDLSSLKICITGGAAIPPNFLSFFEKKFNVRILEGYGLTEASPVCSFNRLELAAKRGSIGIPLTGVDMKIVDDTGRELPRNQIGEVIVRGGNVMKGYYKDEAATASVIKDGWLYTGDMGKMDEENYIF